MTRTHRKTSVKRDTNFTRNVFINCPFDREYLAILRPLLFTVIYLGLKPRIALERADSGETRIAKIIDLIGQSQYAIHDVSRIRASAAGDLSRLNMPFELGIDFGGRHFGGKKLQSKRCLVLAKERYEYQQALSDLAGFDIASHADTPLEAVRVVRDWLREQCCPDAPGAARIWGHFTDFMAEDYLSSIDAGHSPEHVAALPAPELMRNMMRWIEAFSKAHVSDGNSRTVGAAHSSS